MALRGAAITLAVVAAVMFGWGLVWAAGGFAQCAGGADFLADMGWAMAGMLLSLVVGMLAAGYLSASIGCAAGLLLSIVVVALIGLFSGLGGIAAERLSDCPGATRSSGEVFAMFGFAGAAIGLLVGSIFRWVTRRSDASRDVSR